MKNSNQLNNDELLIYNYTLLGENSINKYHNNQFVGKHDSIFMQNYYFTQKMSNLKLFIFFLLFYNLPFLSHYATNESNKDVVDRFYENPLNFPVILNITDACGQWTSGDVNNDGDLNVQDVILMLNIALNPDNYDECQIFVSDLNEDGQINVQDIILLVNTILS